MSLRRLHPGSGTDEVAATEALAGLGLGARAPAGRPYVVANMVSTVDGHATIAGRSGSVGDAVDRELFHRLRTQVDAVLAGTRTLGIEGYGRIVREPDLRAAREREGLAADPLACVISRSGAIPWDIPLFAAAEQTVAVYTAAGAAPIPAGVAATVHLVRLADEELEPGRVLARLRTDHGVRSVLCEGGPSLLASLLADGVLDELFLSLSPKLAGGLDGLRIVQGPALDPPAELELLAALESDGSLFLRYAVARRRADSAAGACRG